jgi:uncharacterized membrane protein (DUF485 family)
MQNDLVQQISSNPTYLTLIRRRGRLSWTLTALMLFVYCGFILLVAFEPELLKQKIGDGATTWGFPLGLGVILVAIVLTGIYVWRANGEFDRLTAELQREFKQGAQP